MEDDYRTSYEMLLRGLSSVTRQMKFGDSDDLKYIDTISAFVRASLAAGAIHDGSIIAYVNDYFRD